MNRHLPWSGEAPTGCRLGSDRAEEVAEIPDKPIVDTAVLESVLESPQGFPRSQLEFYWSLPTCRRREQEEVAPRVRYSVVAGLPAAPASSPPTSESR